MAYNVLKRLLEDLVYTQLDTVIDTDDINLVRALEKQANDDEVMLPFVGVMCMSSSRGVPEAASDCDAVGNRLIKLTIRIATKAASGGRAAHDEIVGTVVDEMTDSGILSTLNALAVTEELGIELDAIDAGSDSIQATNFGYITDIEFDVLAHGKETGD